MTQKIRKERITKAEWYDLGGFEHPALFRQQSRGGAWRYYKNLDYGSTRGVIAGNVYKTAMTNPPNFEPRPIDPERYRK